MSVRTKDPAPRFLAAMVAIAALIVLAGLVSLRAGATVSPDTGLVRLP
jgi:ABC-type transporter Mla maintaining outer membrane lipid asymmetry permease subunit MlaE